MRLTFPYSYSPDTFTLSGRKQKGIQNTRMREILCAEARTTPKGGRMRSIISWLC
jgi:hypothetical protein